MVVPLTVPPNLPRIWPFEMGQNPKTQPEGSKVQALEAVLGFFVCIA